MPIEEILQVDHISRLLKGKYVEEGKVLASGFTYRRNQNGEPIEKELSFNWLEFFDREGSIQENISMIRKVFEKKFNLGRNHRFTVMQVGNIHAHISKGTEDRKEKILLRIEHTPQDDDPSHCSLYGIPFDREDEYFVAQILAACANEMELFPAKA